MAKLGGSVIVCIVVAALPSFRKWRFRECTSRYVIPTVFPEMILHIIVCLGCRRFQDCQMPAEDGIRESSGLDIYPTLNMGGGMFCMSPGNRGLRFVNACGLKRA
ncbi:hypothetical protein BJ170DRAFT_166741 [Xylariales sp. AK1849]|nr:hypothetical protein BJ170DRAFT_166741 [Xylariales sp. AK1849]